MKYVKPKEHADCDPGVNQLLIRLVRLLGAKNETVLATEQASPTLRPPRAEPTERGMAVDQGHAGAVPGLPAPGRTARHAGGHRRAVPLIQREILYRLMVSEQGTRLWQIASMGSQGQRIARAIDWLKAHAAEELRVEQLAASVQMRRSTFHHHFKALTSMSPLQFQKNLRLHGARRLMLSGQMDASTAAFRVGYESPSQFGREYYRLFGAPPRRAQNSRPMPNRASAPGS